jgi:hypothetical protein
VGSATLSILGYDNVFPSGNALMISGVYEANA